VNDLRKPIFDAVRAAAPPGVFDSPGNIAELDRVLDCLGVTASGATAGRAVGAAGIALIQRFECCARRLADGRFTAYTDPGSKDGRPWTIGWGSTGPDIGPGTIWTQAECDRRFARDLQRHADEVAEAIEQAPTAQHQFEALVSFHYNTGAIRRATLTRLHVAGDHAGAQQEFTKWVYNDGRKMAGLVRRRAAEAAHYGGAA
jgi:GH24 family phage-related lysozyme (muramidase)